MSELFANNYSTRLAVGCSNADATITVADSPPAALAAGGQFRILVESEYMLVTAVGGTGNKTWTVTRGNTFPPPTRAPPRATWPACMSRISLNRGRAREHADGYLVAADRNGPVEQLHGAALGLGPLWRRDHHHPADRFRPRHAGRLYAFLADLAEAVEDAIQQYARSGDSSVKVGWWRASRFRGRPATAHERSKRANTARKSTNTSAERRHSNLRANRGVGFIGPMSLCHGLRCAERRARHRPVD
jgi:hypothetical protein